LKSFFIETAIQPFSSAAFFIFSALEVLPNSPAQKAGVVEGSIILEINDEKVNKKSICEIISKIRGEKDTSLKLLVLKDRKKHEFIIKREKIVYSEQFNPWFDMHWLQIADFNHANDTFIPKEIVKKFSLRYKLFKLPKINYWAKRKEMFRLGFDTCMNYNPQNQQMCLINLLNREQERTNADMRWNSFLRKKW